MREYWDNQTGMLVEEPTTLRERLGVWAMAHPTEFALSLTVLGGAVMLALLVHSATTTQQANIDLCVRAFDYTREQCEFIVKVRVRP